MREILPFIISGITTGAIYGLAGTGLVLTYKTSGIFNFGHGAIATAAAYVFYWLYVDHGLDWKLAFFLSVFVLGPLIGMLMERIARRLALQRTAWKIVGTIGLILIVQGLGTIKYGSDSRPVPQYLPKGTETFRFARINIGYDQVVVTLIAIVAVGALYALFRFTRLGISMRAVVDDPDLVDLVGTNPVRVRRIAWAVGSTLAALSGVLIVPLIGLESVALTFLVVQAFGAAAIGFFSNIPLTYLGGIVIGIVADVTKKYVLDYDILRGVPASLPFLVLFMVLLLTPKRRLVAPSLAATSPQLQWHGPRRLRLGMGAIVLVGLALVPQFVDLKIVYWTIALSQVVLFLALGLLVRTAGMVSLCTTAFAAIGAIAFSQLAVDHGVPWVLALLLAGLVAVPVGAIVAIPSIRLSGLFLALATLGFGLMVERLLYPRNWMFTTLTQGREVPRPSFGQSDEGYYYVSLAVVVITVIVMVLIHEGRLGRILRGLSESPVAVSTLGLNTNVTRVIVFCIAAFFTAIGGVLYGGVVHSASGADRYYQSFTSLTLLAVLALAPFREPWYAVFAGVTGVLPGYFTGADTTNWLNLIFGFFAVQVALSGGPIGMPMKLRGVFDRVGGRRVADELPASRSPVEASIPIRRPAATGNDGDNGLRVDSLSVRFGGLTAVDQLSLHAPMNRVTGLIGPNGAGKTTTFNSCSGLNRPREGKVLFQGEDISRLSPGARARRGLGRTFQVMQLCESLTVFDNVALGRESSQAGARLLSQLAARPADRQAREIAAQEAIEVCGIGHLAGSQAGALSTGQRRLVELARCLAGPFDLLLLDEPSSGLDRDETVHFGTVLSRIVAERGCGILLVEHDISLVMQVCKYIYVLDFGSLIFEGDSDAVAASPRVQAAYLGAPADDPMSPHSIGEESLQ
ncbi:MAG: branched-chain amino acid transporter ATPase/permease [Aeromicrobium sp.]|nr:branched-chain amino acid transporter ATPase/permease [Aeromicrobium sp.]